MDLSAIILAGDYSRKFEQDSGTLEVSNKPLIRHVIEAVKAIADEIIIVTDSQERAATYAKILGSNVTFVVDSGTVQSFLMGALKGFQKAQGQFSLLLPFDAPFICPEVIKLLFELCPGRSAVIPRWPNAQVEPLPAVYNTQKALEAATIALCDVEADLSDLVVQLKGVRYVSTLVIQELDPELKTFFRVKTPVDFKKAILLGKFKNKKTK